MKKSIMAFVPGADLESGWLMHGTLTTDHAASSYGQPVFVPDAHYIRDGAKAVYGRGEFCIDQIGMDLDQEAMPITLADILPGRA